MFAKAARRRRSYCYVPRVILCFLWTTQIVTCNHLHLLCCLSITIQQALVSFLDHPIRTHHICYKAWTVCHFSLLKSLSLLCLSLFICLSWLMLVYVIIYLFKLIVLYTQVRLGAPVHPLVVWGDCQPFGLLVRVHRLLYLVH